jgi:hypothetical protein
MYRDDTCAVCGEPLPPDHFYCAEHGSSVDDRLHQLGSVLRRWLEDVDQITMLLGQIAPETWDYLAEQEPDDPVWPPSPVLDLCIDPDDVTIDVDTEPGLVRARLAVPLEALIAGLSGNVPLLRRLADACAKADGANATH